MRIVFGADHAGFDMKQNAMAFVRELGHQVLDVGALTGSQPDDYPDFAEAVGMAIRDRRAVNPIISKLEHADPGVRKMACFALGQIGDPSSIPSLKSALQDATPDVTWNARSLTSPSRKIVSPSLKDRRSI